MKLLIISGFHFDYGLTVAKAFEGVGHEVKFCGYSIRNKGFSGFLRYSLLGRLGYKGQNADRLKFIKETKKIVSDFQPEGILVLRGTKKDFYSEIITDYKERFNKRPKTAIWLLDEIRQIQGGLTSLELFDKWFVIEPTDIAVLKEKWGINGEFLLTGYDSDYYRALNDDEKSQEAISDISFVGTLGQKIRLTYLEHLAEKAWKNNLKLLVVTGRIKFPSIRLKEYPYLQKYLSQGDCDHPRNNRIYNSSKVNLNIHTDHSIEAVNSRFLEIMASGGLQLVEPKEAQVLAGFEPGKDFLTYTGLEDLDAKLKFVFDNPEKAREIAISGHKKTKNHSFLCRAKYITESVFSG